MRDTIQVWFNMVHPCQLRDMHQSSNTVTEAILVNVHLTLNGR